MAEKLRTPKVNGRGSLDVNELKHEEKEFEDDKEGSILVQGFERTPEEYSQIGADILAVKW